MHLNVVRGYHLGIMLQQLVLPGISLLVCIFNEETLVCGICSSVLILSVPFRTVGYVTYF